MRGILRNPEVKEDPRKPRKCLSEKSQYSKWMAGVGFSDEKIGTEKDRAFDIKTAQKHARALCDLLEEQYNLRKRGGCCEIITAE